VPTRSFDDVVRAQYLLIVFAFAGESTMTSERAILLLNPVLLLDDTRLGGALFANYMTIAQSVGRFHARVCDSNNRNVIQPVESRQISLRLRLTTPPPACRGPNNNTCN